MRSLTPPRLRHLVLALSLAGLAPWVLADNLLDTFEAARLNDPNYMSAKAAAEATQAREMQAKAAVLPTLAYAVSATRYNNTTAAGADYSYKSQSSGFTLTQTLIRPASWALFKQGSQQALLATVQAKVAENDLLIRVAEAYFNLLAARDANTYVNAQKTAIAEQLASATRNFEVGTATITDAREAQARYDLVVAQEIAALNDERVKRAALEQLIGRDLGAVRGLKADVVLPTLDPTGPDAWAQLAEKSSPGLLQSEIGFEIAKLESAKALSAHLPTLDLSASSGQVKTSEVSNPTASLFDGTSKSRSVTLSLNVPLFAGFGVQAKLRETLALEEKAKSDLEASRRSILQGVRTAYMGVQAGLSQVKAYQASEASSQLALEANKLGYEVGVRINIDVLNSQSQLYQTKKEMWSPSTPCCAEFVVQQGHYGLGLLLGRPLVRMGKTQRGLLHRLQGCAVQKQIKSGAQSCPCICTL